MMKKTYIHPVMTVVAVATQQMLASSIVISETPLDNDNALSPVLPDLEDGGMSFILGQ